VDTLFSAINLSKSFKLKKSRFSSGQSDLVKAVDDISFDVNYGETLGIVGESGCGKTTLARMIMNLEKPTSGQMHYMGNNITSLTGKNLKSLRRHIQMIFQDPYSSLNPVKSIFYTVAEGLWIHKIFSNNRDIKDKVCETLDLVGLPFSDDMLSKRPDELSGGERQRVGIAKIMVLEPNFIVADEPVSMLDASVRAEIINVLLGAKELRDLTYIFITHEIDIAYAICDRIAVMYAGTIIELGDTEEIIKKPLHPYTKLLRDALPPIHPKKSDKTWGEFIGEGECAYYIEQPSGCKFQLRCKYVTDVCKRSQPELKDVGSNHYLACYL